MNIGAYTGELRAAYAGEAIERALARIPELLAEPAAQMLSQGRNRNARLSLCRGASQAPLDVVVKAFGRQNALKDRLDRARGTKARRTWLAAEHLSVHGVGTPEPVAYLERWDGPRLVESYYISLYRGGLTSFREELESLFHEDSDCGKLMTLMECVAAAVRSMHAAGFVHNDLGNQNILMRRTGDSAWDDVCFVDLNRGRIVSAMTQRLRARDLSRIYLPSDLMRVFRDMYFEAPVPKVYTVLENRYRRLYALHSATRALRHPVRSARERERNRGQRVYPHERDMWIWDERSAQAIAALRPRDRHRYYPLARPLRIAAASLAAAAPVRREYRRLMAACYALPVTMADRVGVAVNPRPATWHRERELLEGLGRIPVMLRFYHHETMREWNYLAQVVRELADAGHRVSIALVQDRRAVLAPDAWAAFASHVLGSVGECVEYVELGHAINRVKWGLWDYPEYGALLRATAAVSEWFPQAAFIGPACIDFEYPDVLAALRQVPPALRFAALSHHLYVDRRGAPENRQGRFAALEKFALARAIARVSPAVDDDRVIVSEVNWPLLGTGVHSPVCSPYECRGPRRNDPSVTEDDYADFMLRYLLIAVCSGMIERVFWWRLVARGFGLVDDTDAAAWRPRPAYEVLRGFLRATAGATFTAKDGGSDGIERFRFSRPGRGDLSIVYAPGEGARRLAADASTVHDAQGALVTPIDGTLLVSGRPFYIADGRE